MTTAGAASPVGAAAPAGAGAARAPSRPLASVLAILGPLSAAAAAFAVAKGTLTAPAALLALALAGAASVILRTLLEPAAGGMPSLQQALHLIRTRRAVFPRDFSGEARKPRGAASCARRRAGWCRMTTWRPKPAPTAAPAAARRRAPPSAATPGPANAPSPARRRPAPPARSPANAQLTPCRPCRRAP
jgi:hypothetical protein